MSARGGDHSEQAHRSSVVVVVVVVVLVIIIVILVVVVIIVTVIVVIAAGVVVVVVVVILVVVVVVVIVVRTGKRFHSNNTNKGTPRNQSAAWHQSKIYALGKQRLTLLTHCNCAWRAQ